MTASVTDEQAESAWEAFLNGACLPFGNSRLKDGVRAALEDFAAQRKGLEPQPEEPTKDGSR